MIRRLYQCLTLSLCPYPLCRVNLAGALHEVFVHLQMNRNLTRRGATGTGSDPAKPFRLHLHHFSKRGGRRPSTSKLPRPHPCSRLTSSVPPDVSAGQSGVCLGEYIVFYKRESLQIESHSCWFLIPPQPRPSSRNQATGIIIRDHGYQEGTAPARNLSKAHRGHEESRTVQDLHKASLRTLYPHLWPLVLLHLSHKLVRRRTPT